MLLRYQLMYLSFSPSIFSCFAKNITYHNNPDPKFFPTLYPIIAITYSYGICQILRVEFVANIGIKIGANIGSNVSAGLTRRLGGQKQFTDSQMQHKEAHNISYVNRLQKQRIISIIPLVDHLLFYIFCIYFCFLSIKTLILNYGDTLIARVHGMTLPTFPSSRNCK